MANGESIDVWSDPWIPDHPPRAPRPVSISPTPRTVNTWFTNSGSGWNECKVRELVIPEDVDKILSLKLNTRKPVDLLGWHYNKSGIYSVKSGYWLATHLDSQQIPPPSGNSTLKSKIWLLKTSPKIKHFLWKICSDILPTCETLQRRHISNQTSCKRCCQAVETAKHLFFDCQYVQAIWRAANIPIHGLWNSTSSLEEILDILVTGHLNSSLAHNQVLPIWLLWRIWKSRNILTFQRKNQEWRKVLRLAKEDVTEWLNTEEFLSSYHTACPGIVRPNFQSQRNWARPARDWIKCNYDASFRNANDQPQAGWIYRDDQGLLKGACQAKGNKVRTALESECQALLQAMQHCWFKGYHKVCFEGDCQTLHNILQNKILHFDSHNWICDIKMWSSKFEEITFTWQRRNNNQAADLLAKKLLPPNSQFLSHFYIPVYLSAIFHADYCNSTIH